mmetsp:Transcript_84550/g.224468  ORF Transcript_84550/g.224468 Transcript_84550/m.224468 type:complete len:253 (-) Transcript_84550:596-1354(-)
MQHEGPILALCQGDHAVLSRSEELECDGVPICSGAVGQHGLHDMAATAVADVAQQVGAQRVDNPLAVLRHMLEHALHDVVGKGVPAEALDFRQQHLEQHGKVFAAARMLYQPAEDAAAKSMASHLGGRARELPRHEAGHACRQCRYHSLDDVVCVLRGHGFEHAAMQLPNQCRNCRTICQLKGSLHQTAPLTLEGQPSHVAAHRRQCGHLGLATRLQSLGQGSAVQGLRNIVAGIASAGRGKLICLGGRLGA